MFLEADLVLELRVEIGPFLPVGKGVEGYLNVIPITGGSFKCMDNSGKYVGGTILPGGADWNTRKGETLAHVFAKYTIQTEDGVLISVENEGYLDDNPDIQTIKTVPKFQVDEDSNYGYLNYGVFVGGLELDFSEKPAVEIKVYKLK
ncbi:MAG: DUF3237 domain-containing protein [Bacillota bacterium]|nr:DUF3237 domain-containing protein [Bacillota bacterium]